MLQLILEQPRAIITCSYQGTIKMHSLYTCNCI